MSFRVGIFVAALCTITSNTAVAVTPNPQSTFDADADGWTVADLNYLAVGSPPTELAILSHTWSATGGNPDGHIWIKDPSANVFYWSAPAEFLSDQSAHYGASLSFDLKYELGSTVFNQEDVVLVGAGRTLVFDTKPVPDAMWRNYTVPLTEGNWRIGSLTGPVADQADLQTVLGNLDKLYIRGDFRSAMTDTGRLDNVELLTAKENFSSSFTADQEGWEVVDLRYPTIGSSPVPISSDTPNWSVSGGNPAGHIWTDDPSVNVFYWSAPAGFLGNKSSSYGTSLSFDLRSILGTFVFNQEDVVLIGAGKTLVFDTTVVPDGSWRNYRVGLTEYGWRIGTLSGTAATREDMEEVLADIEALYIRGEFRGGLTDIGSLDNVKLWEIDTDASPPPIGATVLPGDFNNDRTVDAADYIVWRKNEGTSNILPNDPVGGTIDADQYEVWRTNFGAGATIGAGAALSGNITQVPEAGSLALLTISTLGTIPCWRARRRPIVTN